MLIPHITWFFFSLVFNRIAPIFPNPTEILFLFLIIIFYYVILIIIPTERSHFYLNFGTIYYNYYMPVNNPILLLYLAVSPKMDFEWWKYKYKNKTENNSSCFPFSSSHIWQMQVTTIGTQTLAVFKWLYTKKNQRTFRTIKHLKAHISYEVLLIRPLSPILTSIIFFLSF